MKIIFLGTPEFAQNVLIDLQHLYPYKVVAVVTQPDKKVGRGAKLQYSAVKRTALVEDLEILQFKNINKPEAIEKLKSYNADLMITCAYGQILKQEVLDITPLGVFNIHASLLPKYRGAAPIQWAVINGETKTGITIMKSDKGMDTGDILLKEEFEIKKGMTAGDVFEGLTALTCTGAGFPSKNFENGRVLSKALEILESGNYTLTKQDNIEATYARMLKKEDGLINWNKTNTEIMNLIHGTNSWPGAYTFLDGKKLKVHTANACTGCNEDIKEQIKNAKPGQILIADPKIGLLVKAGEGAVKLSEVQLAGGKRMSDKAFLNGKKLEKGSFFGE